MDRTREMLRRREEIRREMGGAARIEDLHARGRLTAREYIDALIDPGSMREIGTFARSARPADRATTPGDGKIAGRATVDGRGIAVFADDVTVKRASTSIVGARKVRKVYDAALRDGVPLVHFGETGGARIPDIMGSEAFSLMKPPSYTGLRGRRVPMVSVIVGESFGGSSFLAAAGDLTVQIDGTCLAVTSPRVLEAAIGEVLTPEELGGADVHSRRTGQIDLTAPDGPAAAASVREFLSYLPANAWTPPPRLEPGPPGPGDAAAIVPADRRRAWDMRKLIRAVGDDGSPFELMPMFGRSVITALARIEGRPVGVIASQPLQMAGALGPDACDKAVRLICLCDTFGLPLVFLQDTPGFMVGSQVEHGRLLHKATMLLQAIALAEVPKITVIVRKSYGVADYAMGGLHTADVLFAWPGAEIGFMDPEAAASVLVPRSRGADERSAMASAVTFDVDPFGAAATMKVDEIIEPGATRTEVAAALADADGRPARPGTEKPLSTWPNSW